MEIPQTTRASMKIYIDPKPDLALVPTLQAMVARGEAVQAECKRRKVKFLPRQVMRRILAKAGLEDGTILQPRSNDFFVWTR